MPPNVTVAEGRKRHNIPLKGREKKAKLIWLIPACVHSIAHGPACRE